MSPYSNVKKVIHNFTKKIFENAWLFKIYSSSFIITAGLNTTI
jgi:hypothetical protein